MDKQATLTLNNFLEPPKSERLDVQRLSPTPSQIPLKGTNLTVEEDESTHSVSNFFTGISPEPSDGSALEKLRRINRQFSNVSEQDEDLERGNWTRPWESTLSCVGWTLASHLLVPPPSLSSGAISFLTLYIFLAITAGLPILLLEMGVGQQNGAGVLAIWRKIGPLFGGIGVSCVIVSFLVGLIHLTSSAWTIHCLYLSISGNLSVQQLGANNITEGSQSGFQHNLSVHRTEYIFEQFSATFSISGGSNNNLYPTLGTLVVPLFTLLILSKGVKSVGKSSYVLGTLPILRLVSTFAVIGSRRGLQNLDQGFFLGFPPLSDFHRPFIHLLVSLGITIGPIITFASYNRFTHNILRDAIVILGLNVIFTVFATLIQRIIPEAGKSLSERDSVWNWINLGILCALTEFSDREIWLSLYLFSLLLLQLAAFVSTAQTIVSALVGRFKAKLRPFRFWVVVGICLAFLLLSLPLTLLTGFHSSLLLNTYAAQKAFLLVCLAQVPALSWSYPASRVFDYIFKGAFGRETKLRKIVSYLFSVFLRIVFPLLLIAAITLQFHSEAQMGWPLPIWTHAVGCALLALTLAPILTVAVDEVLSIRRRTGLSCWKCLIISSKPGGG